MNYNGTKVDKITYLRETIQDLERLIQRKIHEHNRLVKEKNKLIVPDYSSFMKKEDLPTVAPIVYKEIKEPELPEVYWNEREYV